MASVFSKIVLGEIPCHKVYEDEKHLAFLDISAVAKGHTLVIPKQEVDYIFDMEPTALAELHLFAQKVAKGLKKVVECKRIGVTVIGLEVPHAHMHLIPISALHDMNFEKTRLTQSAEELSQLAAAIGQAIEN